MKKALLIGASGYLGSHLGLQLEQQGVTVERIGRAQVDLGRPGQAEKLDLRVDAIFMASGKTGTFEGFAHPDEFVISNELALLHLLEEHRRQGSGARIVFPSSRLVYRGGAGPLAETAAVEARTIYAQTKINCESYLKLYQQTFGIPYTIFRICVVYGNRFPELNPYGFVNAMVSKASAGGPLTLYGEGEPRRTFTHMADVCNTLILGAQGAETLNGVFNVGGEEFSLLEVARAMAERTDCQLEFQPWPEQARLIETGDTVFDSTALDRILGPVRGHRFQEWCAEVL